VIRVPTGTQDHYPPAFGGAAAIELPPGGERRTELRVDLSELERRIVLCYTGKPRKSAINNWDVFRAHINGNKAVFSNLARISEVAQELRGALEMSNWSEAGRLMREEWSFRKRNLPNITTKTIDRIVDATRRKGALAGKVCGAGGGGCVVLLIEPETRERVEAASARPVGKCCHENRSLRSAGYRLVKALTFPNRVTVHRAFRIIEYREGTAEAVRDSRMPKLLIISCGILLFAGADIPGSERLRSSPVPGGTFSSADEINVLPTSSQETSSPPSRTLPTKASPQLCRSTQAGPDPLCLRRICQSHSQPPGRQRWLSAVCR